MIINIKIIKLFVNLISIISMINIIYTLSSAILSLLRVYFKTDQQSAHSLIV